MLFHLFLLVLIIFTLFFFYTDVMNKINTNKPFAEGFSGTRDARNDSMYTCSTGGSYATYSANTLTPAQKAKVAELYPGKPASYYACVQGCSGGCAAAGDGVMKSVVDAAATTGENLSGKGADYRGKQNKTKGGYTCQNWNSDATHNRHSAIKDAYRDKKNGTGDHNFCRNPTGNHGNIWCYTTDKNKRWDDCEPLPSAAPNGYTYTGESQCQDWNSHYVACQTALDGTTCSIKATTIDECAAECNKRDSCGEMYFKNGVCYLADGKCVPQTNPSNPQPHYKKSTASSIGNIGKLVTYEMLTDKSDFCADGSNKTTKMEWSGEVCEGGKIKWNSMKSLAGTTRPDQAAGCSWNRQGKSDEWITKYIGSCGVSPTYVSLPTTVTELESKKEYTTSEASAPASAASAGMNITSSTKETSSIDPTTGAKVTEKCVTVSELNTAAKWVDHLFGTLSNTKCADKEKVMAAKTASKTDFISGIIKGYQNDKDGSNQYYMQAIDKAKPMLDAAFDVKVHSAATPNSQHPLLQGGEGEGEEPGEGEHIQNNVTDTMMDGATNGLDQNGSVPDVTTLEDQIKQTPAYKQAENQISGNNNDGNYLMANGNLVQPPTGDCPNGCRAPQYDNDKCTNLELGGKAYRSCPWIGDGSINDSMCKDCGSILLPKNDHGYARTRPGLYNKNTVNNLLAGTVFNKEPEKPNVNYTNICLEFMTEFSRTRNFNLPYISQQNYEKIGRIVSKYELDVDTGNTNRKNLTDIINGVLNSGTIPTSLNSVSENLTGQIQPNSDGFSIQTVLDKPATSTDTGRSEQLIKGLLGKTDYYESSSIGLQEKQNDNRLGGSKTLYSGYTTKYRPQDPRKGVKPYDSIWELFKQ